MRIAPSLLSTAIVAALLSAPVVADELTGTLKKIRTPAPSPSVTVTLRFPSPTSAPSRASRSATPDLQLKVVEAVKKELNLPDLKVRYNLVTSQTRIPLVQNGTVDIECGSTTNNEERQKQVDFSVGIFEVGTRLLSKKTANIRTSTTSRARTW